METIYRLSGTTEVAFESEPCEECRDGEAHTLDRALLQTPYPFHDVAVIPRSEDADDDLLHLAFFGNEVLYAMSLDNEHARVLLATLRKAVDLLTERLATLRDVLRTHKARQNEDKLALGARYVDQGLVFANESGGSWKADGISTLYRGIVKRAGLGTLRFHDLRHTAASLMLQEGLPITTVAAILGHANTSTTLSVYAHAIKGSEQGAAVLMEGILQGTAPGPLNLGGRPGGEIRWPNEGQIDPQSSAISAKAL